MVDPVKFETREKRTMNSIKAEFKSNPVDELPREGSQVVDLYVKKIEGSYDVRRAKEDTDNAIDLLYIAYNTTPQENGEIRVEISKIMDKLIRAQQESQSKMNRALGAAQQVVRGINEIFPDWLDAKEQGGTDDIKNFLSTRLCRIAKKIKETATKVQGDLNRIAETYNTIIKDTATVTSTSEEALGVRLEMREALQKEINEGNAQRDYLESLVKDLTKDVSKFKEMAKDFEARAKTAEEREFVLAIVRTGAEVIASALPAVAMAAVGPGPHLASSSFKSGSGETESKNTDDAIQTKKKIKQQQGKLSDSKKKKRAIEDKICDLKSKKTKLIKNSDARKAESRNSVELVELDKRIDVAEKELKREKDKISKLSIAIGGLNASLNALNQNLRQMNQKYESQATSFRELQMKMLDKVEKYEQERRSQAADLVKINALLKGKLTEKETIHLAIKSLNLSLSALKRAKEIIEEIAFFFRSFADFMDAILSEVDGQIESIERTNKERDIGRHRLKSILLWTDEFFFHQTGEWLAVKVVSGKFSRNFGDGWSKLNKLSGKYITGDELGAYLETASDKLRKISEYRQAAADRKIETIGSAKKRLRKTTKA